ncbi:MAG: inositol monophosphatase family protein [Candidatus Paceibacterota bacterium]
MIKEIVEKTLLAAHASLARLGPTGLTPKEKNRFGETCLQADWECEEAVISYLRRENFAARIISEEHGAIDLTPNPFYTCILDGLDGTRQYQADRKKGIYGTILGIFHGLDPHYNDYAAGGAIIHSQNTLITYVKNEGVDVCRQMLTKNHYNIPPLIVDSLSELVSRQRPIFVDEPWEANQIAFVKPLEKRGYTISDLGSSTASYTAIALGEADLVLECTRKDNLEIAAFYGLITELQGLMVTLDGQPLGEQKYTKFGQKDHIPVITCTNKSLLYDLLWTIT